jgi:hypothetical protein
LWWRWWRGETAAVVIVVIFIVVHGVVISNPVTHVHAGAGVSGTMYSAMNVRHGVPGVISIKILLQNTTFLF